MHRRTQTRFSFGTTSAVMTNMGLICGLDALTNPKKAIVGSILVIGLADNISDSMGIHVFQESECLGAREVWFSTATNFVSRLLVSLTFLLLIVFLPMEWAVPSALLWGMALLAFLSAVIARARGEKPLASIVEHVVIALCVMAASRLVGKLLLSRF